MNHTIILFAREKSGKLVSVKYQYYLGPPNQYPRKNIWVWDQIGNPPLGKKERILEINCVWQGGLGL